MLTIITGAAHSGTTILTWILQQHRDALVFVDGPNSCLLENTWLPTRNIHRIQAVLNAHPNHHIILKRPWILDQPWLLEEFPEAQFIYCHREYEKITASWSKSKFVSDELKTCTEAQRKTWDYWNQVAEDFPGHLYHHDHDKFLLNPAEEMKKLNNWLGWRPYHYPTHKVSSYRDIKSHVTKTLHLMSYAPSAVNAHIVVDYKPKEIKGCRCQVCVNLAMAMPAK